MNDIDAMIEIWEQAMQGLEINMISDSDNEKLWKEAFNLYKKVTDRFIERRQ